MAEISRFFFMRHLRSEASSFVLHYRDGELVRSGRGLAFWFLPLSTSVAEVPMDDRELPLIFHGRSADYQEVTAQGVLTIACSSRRSSRIASTSASTSRAARTR